jgi:hypothetical protein
MMAKLRRLGVNLCATMRRGNNRQCLQDICSQRIISKQFSLAVPTDTLLEIYEFSLWEGHD